MISYEEKLYLINLKLDFWAERLQESNNSIQGLDDLGNESKIEGNFLDIDRCSKIIEALIQEKQTLTNQG